MELLQVLVIIGIVCTAIVVAVSFIKICTFIAGINITYTPI
jgi:hypothetical protein